MQDHGDPRITMLQQQIDRTLVRIFGHDSREYQKYRHIASLGSSSSLGSDLPPQLFNQYLHEDRTRAIATLKSIVVGICEELEEFPSSASADNQYIREPFRRKVFVVHGHDAGARESVARFLEKLGLEAIILHEQPDQGLTVIEKFETHASQVGFAVVLLTPDDLVENQSRARQNVIFELGYFVGKIGRGRVCLLRKGEVEEFSDFRGVIYNVIDAGDGWKLRLARELKAAQFDVDLNKAID